MKCNKNPSNGDIIGYKYPEIWDEDYTVILREKWFGGSHEISSDREEIYSYIVNNPQNFFEVEVEDANMMVVISIWI